MCPCLVFFHTVHLFIYLSVCIHKIRLFVVQLNYIYLEGQLHYLVGTCPLVAGYLHFIMCYITMHKVSVVH